MTLADNLQALSASRGRAGRRRKEVLNTLVAMAQERQVKEASSGFGKDSNALENLTPDQVKARTGGGGRLPGASLGPVQTDRLGNKGALDGNFNASLNRLLKDFGGKVKLNSGFRSPERQAQLWAGALKKYGSAAAARKWVAPPGKSLHGKGLAGDLGFSDAATRKLVHSSAAKYGLQFPLGNEPWHIEPIGSRNK